MSKDESTNYLIYFMWGVIVGMAFITAILIISLHSTEIVSEDSLNEACQIITNNSAAIGTTDGDHTLVCELPTYDHVQNIIVRNNSG